MTTPYQRTRALVLAKEFLQRPSFADDDVVPRAIADEASTLLQHFPVLTEIEQAHQALPLLFGPVPPFSRLSGAIDAHSIFAGVDSAGEHNAPLPKKAS